MGIGGDSFQPVFDDFSYTSDIFVDLIVIEDPCTGRIFHDFFIGFPEGIVCLIIHQLAVEPCSQLIFDLLGFFQLSQVIIRVEVYIRQGHEK